MVVVVVVVVAVVVVVVVVVTVARQRSGSTVWHGGPSSLAPRTPSPTCIWAMAKPHANRERMPSSSLERPIATTSERMDSRTSSRSVSTPVSNEAMAAVGVVAGLGGWHAGRWSAALRQWEAQLAAGRKTRARALNRAPSYNFYVEDQEEESGCYALLLLVSGSGSLWELPGGKLPRRSTKRRGSSGLPTVHMPVPLMWPSGGAAEQSQALPPRPPTRTRTHTMRTRTRTDEHHTSGHHRLLGHHESKRVLNEGGEFVAPPLQLRKKIELHEHEVGRHPPPPPPPPPPRSASPVTTLRRGNRNATRLRNPFRNPQHCRATTPPRHHATTPPRPPARRDVLRALLRLDLGRGFHEALLPQVSSSR